MGGSTVIYGKTKVNCPLFRGSTHRPGDPGGSRSGRRSQARSGRRSWVSRARWLGVLQTLQHVQ